MAIDFLAIPILASTTSRACRASARRRVRAVRSRTPERSLCWSTSKAMACRRPSPDPHKPPAPSGSAGHPILDTDSLGVNPTSETLASGMSGDRSSGPQFFWATGRIRMPRRPSHRVDGKRFFRTAISALRRGGLLFIVDGEATYQREATGWPSEVEAILYGHPDVQEAFLLGTQIRTRETVTAIVASGGQRGKVEPRRSSRVVAPHCVVQVTALGVVRRSLPNSPPECGVALAQSASSKATHEPRSEQLTSCAGRAR